MARALFIIAALLIACGSALAIDIQKDNKSPDTASGQNYKKDSSPSSVVAIVSDVMTGIADTLGDWLHRFHEEIIAASTLGLFFVTTALAVYTARLWSATSRLVEGADKTAKRQLRAYVWEKADVPPSETPDGYLVWFGIKNTGKTPAYEVCCWTDIAAIDHLSIAKFKFKPAPKKIDDPRFVVNPRSTHTKSQGIKLTADEKQAVEDGVKRLVLWGEMRYMDAFNCDHTTKFRLAWRVREGLGMWVYCDDGNKSD